MSNEIVMTEVVKTIVKAVVDKPEVVSVAEIEGDTTSIIEILVDQDDLGKAIGKNGKTAQNIRGIVYAAAYKTRKRYTVDIQARRQE